MGSAAERKLKFKIAKEPWELEQVHELNYRTFVEEIRQHSANPERRLVDQLLATSTCYVCLEEERLVGMVAISNHRPFSIDRKLPEPLESYLPITHGLCEIRLLAVERERRGSLIFGGLFTRLLHHSRENGYHLAVISAAETQVPLYRHIGFVPFGPPLGTSQAAFQGMYLTWDRLSQSAFRLLGED